MIFHTLPAAIAILLMTVTASASGILAPNDVTLPPLRVTDHLVDVTITDGIARTTLTQTFRNDTKRRLEATYIFPLASDADLTDFRMTFNGKMVEGEVLPADQALQLYEQIVRQARDPGLIEFIGHRLLRMRVFPIEPESDTTIKLEYHQVCRPIGGMKGYHYPLRTSKTDGKAHGTVRFNVKLESSAPIKNIWSPTHAVEIVRADDEHTARCGYEASGGSLEQDFMLLYDSDSNDVGLSVVTTSTPDAHGHFVLMLTPRQLWPQEEYEPQDVVFVVDTSGSMAGEKLDQARNAIRYCIEQLDERDRFTVVRFSTGFDRLFDIPTRATRENKDRAREWVGEFKAAGGTNITDTLASVIDMRATLAESDDAERPFVTVFMTDGRGNRNPEETMNVLRERTDDHKAFRVFPFGVGHDVNTRLLDGLAQDFTGRSTYVQPGENLELVLGDFFSIVSRPVLTDLRLEMPDVGSTDVFPATLGDLYHGQQLVVAGRFDRDVQGPVRLVARRGGERVEFAWPDVSFKADDRRQYVETVWAGRKIAYLLDQIRAHGESSEMIEEIMMLSRRHGIQTPYSSWFVNPEGIPVPATREDGRLHFQRLQQLGAAASPPPTPDRMMEPAGRGASGFSEDAMREALADESGEGATLAAKFSGRMRELRTADRDSLGEVPGREIDGKWYHTYGAFLVDEEISDALTETITIKFASPAYFELLRGRKDLRSALAASPAIALCLDEETMLIIHPDEGMEEFDVETREHCGLSEG